MLANFTPHSVTFRQCGGGESRLEASSVSGQLLGVFPVCRRNLAVIVDEVSYSSGAHYARKLPHYVRR